MVLLSSTSGTLAGAAARPAGAAVEDAEAVLSGTMVDAEAMRTNGETTDRLHTRRAIRIRNTSDPRFPFMDL